MTLRLAVELTARDQGVASTLKQTRGEIRELRTEAATADRQAVDGARASAQAARDAAAGVNAHVAAVKSAAQAMQQYQAAARTAAAIDRQFGIGGGSNTAQRAKDIAAYGQELDRLRAKYSPLFAAQQAYRAELTELRHALRVGALSQREFDAALARTKTQFASTVVQIQGFRGGLLNSLQSIGRYRTQIQGLGYQVGDFAVQVASGQSALVAFAQQGSQALQLFGGPWGAVIGAALAIVSALAVAMFDFGDATDEAAEAADKAEEKQRKFNDAYRELKSLMGEIDGVHQRTRESLEAEARGRVVLIELQAKQAQGELAIAEAELARQRAINAQSLANAEANATNPFLSEFGTEPFGLIDTGAAEAAAEAARKASGELNVMLLEMRALTGEFDDGRKLWGQAFEVAETGAERAAKSVDKVRQATGGTTDAVAALLATFDPLPGSFAAYARAEAELELQHELGIITIDEYTQRLRELAEAHDLAGTKAAASAQAATKAETTRRQALGRTRDAQDELADFVEQSADRIGDALEDSFGRRGELSFRRLLDAGRSVFSELLQWGLKLGALNPLKNWLSGGAANLPTLGSIFSGTGTPFVPGGASVGGSSVGGVGGGSSGFGGLSFGGLLGDGGGLGTLLFGSPATLAAGGSGPSSVIASTSGLFGAGGGGGFGAFLNTPFGGGLASGALALGAALLSGQGLAQAGITAGLTGIGTAVGGPIGGFIGGAVGSLLGGLFGKKNKTKTQRTKSYADLNPNALGLFEAGDYFVNKRGSLSEAQELGRAAEAAFNAFALDIGATFAPDVEGRIGHYAKVKSKNGKVKSQKEYFQALFGLEDNSVYRELGRGETEEEAIALLISGGLAEAARLGKVSGVSETTLSIFRNVAERNSAAGGFYGVTDQAEIQQMVAFGRFYDRTDEIRTAADAAGEAIKQLTKELRAAEMQAEEYGLDVAKVREVFRANFVEGIQDELLALTDPQAAALAELEKEYAARKATAVELGVDLAEIEKLYALKRQQVLDQGLKGVADSWQDFINQLQFGDASALSPTAQLENARLQYEAAKGQGGAAFRDAAGTYLGLLGNYYGGTEPYAAVYREIIELAKKFGGLSDIPGFAAGGDHAGGWMWTGERGPELVATGRARVFNAQETAEILHFPKLNQRAAQIRAQQAGGGLFGATTGQGGGDGLAMARFIGVMGDKFDGMTREQARLNKNLRLLIESGRRRDAA